MSQWPVLRNTDWLLTVGGKSRSFQRYWNRCFDSAYEGKVDSWAYRWTFSCWSQSGLCILPAHNLVRNIGFGEDATHTRGNGNRLSVRLEQLIFPLSHPLNVVRNYAADHWTEVNIFNDRLIHKVKARLSLFFVRL